MESRGVKQADGIAAIKYIVILENPVFFQKRSFFTGGIRIRNKLLLCQRIVAMDIHGRNHGL